MQEKPLVSIITPSFNQGVFIEETIQSVLSQDYQAIEYIIVDGGSTDSTLEVLRRYDGKIRWISEPDRGQADAVNKGMGMARGAIIGWLNSDDTYNPGAVGTAVKYFLAHPEIVMLYSDAYFINKSSHIIGEYQTKGFTLKHLSRRCIICQPSVFMRANVIGDIGRLNTDLHTCMDYEYWIRIGKAFPQNRIAYIKGTYFANSRVYKENKTFGMRKKVYEEVMMMQKKYFGRIATRWIYGYIKEVVIGLEAKKY